MDHFLKQCDRDLMKMAMLKHEKTFRQQVNELHRVYRLQKQLMRDVSCTKGLKRQRNSHRTRTCRALNLQLPADEFIVSTEDEHETELELTLAIGCARKKREGMPLSSDRFMVQPFDKMNNTPWLVHCLRLRMS